MKKMVTILATALLVLALCSITFAAEQDQETSGQDRCATGLYGYSHSFYHTYWAGQCPGQERPADMGIYNRNSFYPEAYRYGGRNCYWEHGPGWRGPAMYRYYRFGDRDSVPMFKPKPDAD